MSQQRQQPAEEDPLLRDFPDQAPGPVLLSDQIQYYCLKLEPPLICHDNGALLNAKDFEDCLDNACYKLRLGYEANVGGSWIRLSETQPLRLAPHQVAVVQTLEWLNIPRFLVARWNLRVTMVYQGLLWVGGPQVDPGWSGRLFCPIYNLAEREVVLYPKDRVFTIDFTRTTRFFTEPAPWGYRSKEEQGQGRQTLQDHDRHRLQSAPFEELRRVREVETKLNSVSFLVLGLLTFIIAALGVLATLGDRDRPGLESATNTIAWIALVAGVVAIIMSVTANGFRTLPIPKRRYRYTFFAIIAGILLPLGTFLITQALAVDFLWADSRLGVGASIVLIVCALGIGVVSLYLLWRGSVKQD